MIDKRSAYREALESIRDDVDKMLNMDKWDDEWLNDQAVIWMMKLCINNLVFRIAYLGEKIGDEDWIIKLPEEARDETD